MDVIEYGEGSLNMEVGHKAVPYPQYLLWTRDGVRVVNSTMARFGYPVVSFINVSRTDAGNYRLLATNYELENPSLEIGTSIGSFELNVKCKSSQI